MGFGVNKGGLMGVWGEVGGFIRVWVILNGLMG